MTLRLSSEDWKESVGRTGKVSGRKVFQAEEVACVKMETPRSITMVGDNWHRPCASHILYYFFHSHTVRGQIPLTVPSPPWLLTDEETEAQGGLGTTCRSQNSWAEPQ